MSIDQRALTEVGHVLSTGTSQDEEVYVHLHATGLHLEIVEAPDGPAVPRHASARIRTQAQAMELIAAIGYLATQLPPGSAVPAPSTLTLTRAHTPAPAVPPAPGPTGPALVSAGPTPAVGGPATSPFGPVLAGLTDTGQYLGPRG